jgi:hypothetical protein
MPSVPHIDAKSAARIKDLAERVRAALLAAGIPAFDAEKSNPSGGARIEVDTVDDEGCGVYITWAFSRSLTDEISGHLVRKELDHETIQYSGKIRIAMTDAIIAILQAAGFSAELSKDDMRPLEVWIPLVA